MESPNTWKSQRESSQNEREKPPAKDSIAKSFISVMKLHSSSALSGLFISLPSTETKALHQEMSQGVQNWEYAETTQISVY